MRRYIQYVYINYCRIPRVIFHEKMDFSGRGFGWIWRESNYGQWFTKFITIKRLDLIPLKTISFLCSAYFTVLFRSLGIQNTYIYIYIYYSIDIVQNRAIRYFLGFHTCGIKVGCINTEALDMYVKRMEQTEYNPNGWWSTVLPKKFKFIWSYRNNSIWCSQVKEIRH